MMADDALQDVTTTNKAERDCWWCGVDIAHLDPRAITCSKFCKGKRDNALNPSYTRKPSIDFTCKVCGSNFKHIHPRAKICSDECRAKERQRQSARAAQKRKEQRHAAPLGKTCHECGGKFFVERKRGSVYRLTCSDECASARKNRRWAAMLQAMTPDQRNNRKSVHRAWERNRSAQAAISLLILPVESRE